MRLPLLVFVTLTVLLENALADPPDITLTNIGSSGGDDFFLQEEDTPLNFFDAKGACERNGKRLAKVLNAGESSLIGQELLNRAESGKSVTWAWTAGNDLGSEGEWEWISDGTPLTGYSNWGDFSNDENNNCLVVYPNTAGNWNPIDCNNEFALALCQSL